MNWSRPFSIGAAAALLVLLLTPRAAIPPLEVVLVAAKGAAWRGAQPELGKSVPVRIMHLARGAVALRFPQGTSVTLEGPAWFQVLDNETIELSIGTITVHHEGAPGRFKVLTPVGELTDFGTTFGVCVGTCTLGSVVLAEVYEGEVHFRGADAMETRRSVGAGDAFAIVGNREKLELSREFQGKPVRVSPNFDLTVQAGASKSAKNIALGRPVYSPAYYNDPRNGENFPPTALTDGRLADTGSPGDWSFWLAADGDSGSFTLDLEETHTISRIELQNTRNRHYGDRGMERFEVAVSVDGERFAPLLKGRMERVSSNERQAYRFQTFDFPPITVRFIRVTGLSHYRDEEKPSERAFAHSGGLNEIRVFP